MLKCDYRRHDSLASAHTSHGTLQKRRHAPSNSVESIVTARRTVPENELPELPEDEPRLSVSELNLYVVNFVHIILSLSRDEMFQNLLLTLRSPQTQHLGVFDKLDPWVSWINLQLLGLSEHTFQRYTRMGLLVSRRTKTWVLPPLDHNRWLVGELRMTIIITTTHSEQLVVVVVPRKKTCQWLLQQLDSDHWHTRSLIVDEIRMMIIIPATSHSEQRPKKTSTLEREPSTCQWRNRRRRLTGRYRGAYVGIEGKMTERIYTYSSSLVYIYAKIADYDLLSVGRARL